jgi:hypothetical protein
MASTNGRGKHARGMFSKNASQPAAPVVMMAQPRPLAKVLKMPIVIPLAIGSQKMETLSAPPKFKTNFTKNRLNGFDFRIPSDGL